MGKEGSGLFLFNSRGKINIGLVLSLLFIFVMMLWVVNAITITQTAPTASALNGSRTINFTFTPLWDGDDQVVGNCTIWTNITGTWAATKVNESVGLSSNIANNSLSWINYTFDRDGLISWSVACNNATSTGGDNFSVNRTLTIDATSPSIIADTPKGVITSNTQKNFTAYPLKLMVNVSDNTTSFVWAVLNSLANGAGTNETGINRTMTFERDAAGGGALYNFTLDGILNFSSQHLSPGVHSVFFCANDSLDSEVCAGPYDYIIKGTNVSEMERMFGAGDMSHASEGFSFSGMDIRYGNGTDVPFGTFMNPTSGNYTFNMNFTSETGVYIVGASINESAFANARSTNYSGEVTNKAKQELGTGYKSNLTWVDISGFIPPEIVYSFGIVQMPGTFGKVMYCNGTTTENPGCAPISVCNASAIGLHNSSLVIPQKRPTGAGACYLTSGQWGEEPVTLTSGFTYIFTRTFSGGLGGNDRGVPDINFTSPQPHTFNVSTAAARLINFTVQDINSTGINLTANHTINLSISLGDTQVGLFSYINDSSTNLTCTTDDIVSPGNTTSVNCNVTFNFNSGNGTFIINATARDDSNNTNFQFNVTRLILDQIPPVNNYFNISDSTSLNASGDDSALQLGASTPASIPLSGSGSWAQGRTFFATANWTDNQTNVLRGLLQFYNETAGSWQTLNESEANYLAYSNNSWTNFTFPVPAGHNVFEGNNVTFRILANDTLGNVNSSAVINLTISINDTTVPEISIPNGTIQVNGTNTSDTTPTISWVVNERSHLTSINVSIDGTLPNQGLDGCAKSAFFSSTSSGTDEVNNFNRNGTFTVKSTPSSCPLGNGSHTLDITAIDSLGNSLVFSHTFSIQSGSVPGLQFNLTKEDASGTWIKAAINNSNITSSVGITLFGTNGAGASINKISYTSSCDSTTRVEGNNTVVYPFNASSCSTQSGNRTLTVTINDTAGNSNTTVLGFLVDNVAPSIVVHNPTGGQTFSQTQATLNVSVLDDDQALSSIGYFLNGGGVPTIINISSADSISGGAGINTTSSNLTNFTAGTHTIKFTVNDTLGNIRNSSVITFVQDGPIAFLNINASLEGNLTAHYNANISNISIRQKTDAGTYSDISVTNDSTNTYEILYQINGTTNVTLTEINGSAANWDKLNIVPVLNDTRTIAGIQNNWTNTVLSSVVFNNTLEEFISGNNSYHGVVVLPFILNISNASKSTVQEFWWIKNEDTLTTRTNISQCTTGFSVTSTTPCWNYTTGSRTMISVPHFSVVAAINDTTVPTITVNTPSSAEGNQTAGMFEPNVTVSTDAVSCKYSINTTEGTANKSMTKSGTACIGSTERFKNQDSVYNITFYATDASNNIGTLVFKLNVSDNTASDSGTSISSSVDRTSATVTISTVNETVNATVAYGTTNTSLGSTATQTDFSTSQTVSISGLTAGTKYYYNFTVCDFNGNCNTNTTVFSFTTSAAAAAAAAATTGGGGGGAAPVTKVADSKAQVWSKIPAGSSISLNVDRATIAVTSVAVNNVKSELKSVDLEVAALKENPVSTVPAPKVYQYLRISKKKLKNTDAEEFKVGFRVTKSWLTANNLASGDIALYRYKSGWNELTTRVTGTDNVYVNYEADTPGLSSFAIGVSTAVEVPEVAPGVPEVAPGEVLAPTAPTAPERVAPVAPPEAVEKPEPVEAPTKAPGAWLIAAIVVIIGIILIVMYQRRKNPV